jgi:predicted nucleotidyltransferase
MIANTIREQHEEVTAIKLFGSFARKDFTGRSDADILIVLADSDEEVLNRILRFRKFFDLEIPVDVLVYTEDEIKQALSERNMFIMGALKEGIEL